MVPHTMKALLKAFVHRTEDPNFRMARIWSNNELKKFAHFFSGSIVNVSAGEDRDKQGDIYKKYFTSANSYSITNFFDGREPGQDEFFLNLEAEIDDINMIRKFDVVFNHTVLEHIYNITTAFKNLCALSKDVVIIVVPFMQQMHGVSAGGCLRLRR